MCVCACVYVRCYYIIAVFNPPIITAGVMSDGVLVNGVLTINETGLLNLDCNSANSDGIPPVVWLDEDGVEVSDKRVFEIDNIQRNLSGRYICVTETPDPINSRNSGVVVIVQCKAKKCVSVNMTYLQ